MLSKNITKGRSNDEPERQLLTGLTVAESRATFTFLDLVLIRPNYQESGMVFSMPPNQIPSTASVPVKVDREQARNPWLRIGEWILLTLLVVEICVSALPKAWQTLNTDFPNYYLTARLVREHYDSSRVYEWIWLQRQKDHRDIDQRIVGMVPITPFSTLAVYPLTSLAPLAAKHWWLAFNVGLLFATIFFLHDLTELPWQRIGLVAALSFPLRVNFLYGQYYVLLLFLLVLSCWLYIRHHRLVAGVAIGVAAGLKIFPVIFFIYFLRKRDLRAFAGGVLGGLGAAVVSILTFGWELHRTYLTQVLPSALRGEGLDPYNLRAASLSSLLHRLFIYEPQLNRHPALNAPWLFAVFHPLLQMAVIGPALLLVAPKDVSPRRVRLEWATIVLISLALSTSASSYLFTLLVLPACFVIESLQRDKRYLSIAIFLVIYVAAGMLGGTNSGGEGWSALLAVPRLYAAILLCIFIYMLLLRLQPTEDSRLDRSAWAAALLVLMAFGITGGLRHQRGLYADYQWRLTAPDRMYMAVDPVIQGDAILFVAMTFDGYQSAEQRGDVVNFSKSSPDDNLAVTAAGGEQWIEQSGLESTIESSIDPQRNTQNAESPVASADGRWLAFLREDHGRARIWIRDLNHPDKTGVPITPPELNVFEMSFLPKGVIIFAANSSGRRGLFTTDHMGSVSSIDSGAARYPSVSPDGHWLAYSQLRGGNWNLWLRNLDNGNTQRLTSAECNSIEPAWTADSETLLYASDCGRALWFTALCRRHIPH